MCLPVLRVWISLSQQCVCEMQHPCCTTLPLCFVFHVIIETVYCTWKICKFSQLLRTILFLIAFLWREWQFALWSSAYNCFFPRTFPQPPQPWLQWKPPQMSKDQNGNCKQKREVWEQYSRVAALVLPSSIWFRDQPKILAENLGISSMEQHKYNSEQVRQNE